MKTVRFNTKNRCLIRYPNNPFAIRPVSHSPEVPILITSFVSEDMDQHMQFNVHLPFDNHTNMILEKSPSSSNFNQAELNDLVGDYLVEYLVSRLTGKNGLAPGTNEKIKRR